LWIKNPGASNPGRKMADGGREKLAIRKKKLENSGPT